jgi:flagellar secretion chaperone FliS
MTSHNAHDVYLENRVLSAGPIELVRILYQTAANAVREARRHLEAGDVLARSRAISKASEAILELTRALDFDRGGEIAKRLVQLYTYMLRRLTEANFQQADAPLAEVLALLATLSEGWDAIGAPAAPSTEPDERWARAALPLENTSTVSEHAWSF